MEKKTRWAQIREGVKKASKHEIRNSYKIRDFYRDFVKTCPRGNKISCKDYSSIIKLMNSKIIDELIEVGDVVFPQEMGGLYIKVTERKLRLVNGKIRGLNIDWSATAALWMVDEEARLAKTVVRDEKRILASVNYRRARAIFPFRSIYALRISRRHMARIYNRIHGGHNYIFKSKGYE